MVRILGVIVVGTSGWQYADWRGRLYPEGLPQRLWLEHYAATFATVEINNAFYRLPERATFEQWRRRTPDDLIIAVKMSRYLTHIKRLRDPAEPVARFLDRARGLGSKLGPVLLQLPPTLRADPGVLDAVLRELGANVRVAVEARHASWWNDEIRSILTKYSAALCWADRHSRPIAPQWRTADFGYLRLHQGRTKPGYGQAALDSWVGRIAEAYPGDADVFVYFNNDTGGAAVEDAITFARRARRRGLDVSRTP
jgi:uncharacterized protein YecE (DUF72 family)